MPSRLILILSCAALFSAPAISKEYGEKFQVGNWNGDAYSDDQTGGFSHCAAGVTYRDGRYLIVSVGRQFNWSVGLMSLPFRLPQQNMLQVLVSFDNVGPYQLGGEIVPVGTTQLLRFEMPNTDVAVSAFREARGMTVIVDGRNLVYVLTSSREIIPALTNCVNSHIQAPSAAAPVVNSLPASPPPKPAPNPDAIAARDKLILEAGDEYNKCIQANMKEIVPYSNESADVLAQVIITKCGELQAKYVELNIALYGMARADVEKMVGDALDVRKKTIVADIVTFRAALNKALSAQPAGSDTKIQSKDGQGL